MAALQKSEWNGHDVIKLLKRLSLKECLEYLMNRYMKENATLRQYSIYPFVLQQLSIKYLGQSLFWRFKSSLTDKSKIELLNEQSGRLKIMHRFVP